ncbi:MAG: PD-(D/E)XK nuclease family protein [Deltaproteobacteria bacterium]
MIERQELIKPQLLLLHSALKTLRELRNNYERQLTPNFNIFSIMAADEVHFTKLFAFLLDPEGDHKEGDIFLNQFMQEIGIVDISTLGQFDFVKPEYNIQNGKIDIFIQYYNHTFIVENKLWGDDSKCQLDKYIDWIEAWEGNYSIIYLSLKGEDPKHCKRWDPNDKDKKYISLSYKDIYNWLVKCKEKCKFQKNKSFIEMFQEWIIIITGGAPMMQVMQDKDIVKNIVCENKDIFNVLWEVTKVFDLKDHLTEKCVKSARNELIQLVKNKFSVKYLVQVDNEEKFLNTEGHGDIYLYKEDWVKDGDLIIYYAIETHKGWTNGIYLGISRKKKNFKYPHEDDIFNALKEMADTNQYEVTKDVWWVGTIFPRMLSGEKNMELVMAWYLAHDQRRKQLLDELVEIMDQMIQKTESIIDAAVQELKNT